MHIKELDPLATALNCTFNVQTTGSPEWIRAFVIDSRGLQIGRLSFRNNLLYNFKNYKRGYIRTLDETDQIAIRLDRYLNDKTVVSLEDYEDLAIKAEKIRIKDLREKREWRKANPLYNNDGSIKHRRRLEGKNVRHILTELVMAI